MSSLSQQNLLKLALEDEAKGHLESAIQNLEEALNFGHNNEITVKLCALYRKTKREDQAYTLIKEEPDLFSNKEVYFEYLKILKANHFYIEKEQLARLLNKKIPILIESVNIQKQNQIIKEIRSKTQITQMDYQKLMKLDLVNFKSFAQSVLLDPSQSFALRLALCEDLVKLKLDKTIQVWVLGEVKGFIPKNSFLLEKDPIFQEIIAAVADRFKHNPSQLTLILGEMNLVLGSIYPFLNEFIDNPDSFVKDLLEYLTYGKTAGENDLIQKIYSYLPK